MGGTNEGPKIEMGGGAQKDSRRVTLGFDLRDENNKARPMLELIDEEDRAVFTKP